jgi:hypothetical protein
MKNKDIGIFSSIGENANFLNRVQKACDIASENLLKRATDLGNRAADIAQGNFAESWHAETFNVDAMLNRMDAVAAKVLNSTESKSVDIAIQKHGETVTEYSSKYYAKGKASVNSQKGYGNQERLIPSDQMEEAKAYADRQIIKDTYSDKPNRIQNAKDIEEVKEKLTDRLSHKEGHKTAESEPIGRKENEQQYKAAKRGENIDIRPQIDAAKIAEESLRSGAVTAAITLSITVAPRVYNHIVHRVREGEWPPDSVKTIFEGAASATGEAGLRAAVATSLTMSAKAGLLGQAMRTVDPTIIGTLTFIAFEGAKDFSKFRSGQISGEIFADNIMSKSTTACAGAYGAAIGQAVIPIPILGAMIGAMVGSISAQYGYKFLDTASEAYFRSVEFAKIKEVNLLLALEWNQFLTNYENWKKSDQNYQTQKTLHLQHRSLLNSINDSLDLRIMRALEEDNE